MNQKAIGNSFFRSFLKICANVSSRIFLEIFMGNNVSDIICANNLGISKPV